MKTNLASLKSDLSALELLAHDAGAKMAENVSHLSSDIIRTGNEWMKDGDNYVRKNPRSSVAMAAVGGAAAGFLVTYLMTRRS